MLKMSIKKRIRKLEDKINMKKDFLQYLLIFDGRVLNNNELKSEDEFKQNQCVKDGIGN